MKKFGTPIWAGPGRESEKVGVEAEGTPAPLIEAAEGVLRIAGLRAAALWGPGPGACPGPVVRWLEGFSPRACPGADVEDEPVVVEELELLLDDREAELELEGDDEDEEEEEEEDDDGLLVVVVELLDELAGAQDSDSDATTPVTGSDI